MPISTKTMNVTDFARTWLRNWYSIFIHELKLIFSDSGAMVIFFVGGLLYPVLYNLIYMNGTVPWWTTPAAPTAGGTCKK